jgi:hypothetical protein
MKKLAFIISVMFGVLASCSEPFPETIELEQFMNIALSGAADGEIVNTIEVDGSMTYPLSVSYGGTTNYEHGDIVAEIGGDNLLVTAFNAENGTSYLPLPAGAWKLNKSSVTIPNGDRVSDITTLTVNGPALNFVNEYLLPVTLKSVSGGDIPINEELKTVYFIVKGNVEHEALEGKWTVHDASSVWQAPYPVENVWDGNANSYWHSDLSGMPQWFAINMNAYKLIEGFTWRNRQDAGQNSLPKHVKFETSMDGSNWTEVLDIAELPNNRVSQVFDLPEKVIAKYFKVTILSTWTGDPYTYVAEVSVWAGDKPTGDYDWEKNTWTIIDFKSQWNDSGWAVKNIFDGNKDTCWHSEPFDGTKNGMPQWFIVDMQKVRPAIKGFLIWNRQNDHGMEPKHVLFSISDDNVTYTPVLDLEEMSSDYTKELNYKTTSPKSGRYLKVEVLTNWGGGDWTYFGEITTY